MKFLKKFSLVYTLQIFAVGILFFYPGYASLTVAHNPDPGKGSATGIKLMQQDNLLYKFYKPAGPVITGLETGITTLSFFMLTGR